MSNQLADFQTFLLFVTHLMEVITKDLFSDAMIPENTMQHRLRIDEILAEDLIEGRDGAAEVFGNEF